jgi:glycosyltransferase involved in cell wall biosynthesis
MKIAYDHQVFVQQRFGGISRYFAELASHLHAGGSHQVSIIAPFHQNDYLTRPDLAGVVHGRRLQRNRFISIRSALRWANRLALPLAWHGKSFDIVHETFFSERTYGRCRARILTVYDMIHELFPNQLAQSDSIVTAKRIAVARADHIICISETTRRDLVRLLSVDPARTSVVYLGHSLSAPSGNGAFTPPTRSPYILYVGDRGSYKNFPAAVEAYASSPKLRAELRLLAFGGRPFNSRELAWLAALGIADKVQHEAGDDALLAARYRGARLFVCPSTYEGFGLPPLEAMAYGCPVSCSTQGSIPEVVGDAGEYFDPLDIEAAAAAMERLCFDEARRDELVRLGYQRAALFTWNRCAVETATVYQRLL